MCYLVTMKIVKIV